ncbi:hypothetical protein ABPG75_002509 [Micractinium tetrahymenae]
MGAHAGGGGGGAADSHHFSMFGMSKLVVAVVASLAWMSVSSGLILLNKDLLSHGFHYPMALSGLGMAFSGAASYVCCRVLRVVDAKRSVTPRFYATKILPVGLFMALTLHFGNLVYLYLTVAFIQMLKAFTPIITMIALFVARLETPSRRLVGSVSFIALGTALASAGEVNLNVMGVVVMMLSECFESIRLVMTQLLLTGLRFHPIEGLMYLAPACTFWLALGSLCLEFRPMLEAGAFGLMAERPLKFLSAAAMGFMVNSLAYIVIQSASSLTLKVLGTVKNALVVCLGIVLLSEKVTLLQGVGYAISVGAFFVYQRIKMQQIQQEQLASLAGNGASHSAADAKESPSLPRYQKLPAGDAVAVVADSLTPRQLPLKA